MCMVKSMTGYGLAQFENDECSISVEVKSLNSKFLDIVTKLPKEILTYENELRKIIADQLVRGKINFSIEITPKNGSTAAAKIDPELFQHYHDQFKGVSSGLNVSDGELFNAIMNLPDVLGKDQDLSSLLDKKSIEQLTRQATDQCDIFRIEEGKSIETAMKSFGEAIMEKLALIKEKDPQRVQNIKDRINESLNNLDSTEKSDPNRFEQELIYYIEKLDLSEEYVRLENHIKFFQETLISKDSQGKKLGFISQEMGREINTIGSKANDSDIQKLVVEMKDELEKIKEQVLNIV